ncbi:MAG: hypothetical protein RIB67_04170 [Miltoncostaeaceae bacterium]
MGRIADAALRLLSDGPAPVEMLARQLQDEGTTRARDPIAALRRALRDDPRVLDLPDGRLASLDQALAGLELTVVVDGRAAVERRVDIEPDLAPLALLGLGPALDLPAGVRAGETVAVRIDVPAEGALTVRAVTPVEARPHDEAALLDAVGAALVALPGDDGWAVPVVAHLGAVVATLAADRSDLLRHPGRPLREVLSDGGFEAHLAWVGEPGTDWMDMTSDEVEALEDEVGRLLVAERPAEAAALQERLLDVLRRHLPGRVPVARRRLARALARAGRPEDALAALVGNETDDPEDWYEATVIASRRGDEIRARRWAESGLARLRPGDDEHAAVARCLDDLAGDLDAQAAFLRARVPLEGIEADADGAGWLAAAVARIPRSYLVEVLLEEVGRLLGPDELRALIDAAADLGDAGRDLCAALGRVLAGASGRRARAAAGPDRRPAPPVLSALLDAHPAMAWSTLWEDAADQRQLIVGVGKESGRLAPLVVLIDLDDMDGAVKDAFFLPDMVEERIHRELLRPMEEMGLRCPAIPVGVAVGQIDGGLRRTAALGWELPSERHQPVLARIRRQILLPRGIAG